MTLTTAVDKGTEIGASMLVVLIGLTLCLLALPLIAVRWATGWDAFRYLIASPCSGCGLTDGACACQEASPSS
jgi:hypothetical protein